METEHLRNVPDNLLADRIANDFTRRYPEFAVRTGPRPWQRIGVGVAAGAVVVAAVMAPVVLLAVLSFVLLGSSILQVVIAAASLGRGRGESVRPPADCELPRYTVLVPAYREEAVIGDLVRHLAGLDYPHHLLEVLILVERHDPSTKQAVLAAQPPEFVRVVELPAGAPQTKPRSCNYGLLIATGELLTIFDAEDRPDRDQLRRAAAYFAAGGDRLVGLQAKLVPGNGNRNALTKQFAMEYALRYGMLVPGLSRIGLPIPLGGSSNHFRTGPLRKLGGWDAWNVTEDADLGMRCAARGYRVEVLDSVTLTEAPPRLGVFVRQRTRWHKGFLMTAMVHTRQPRQTLRRFGIAGLSSVVGIIAATPVAGLTTPIVLMLLWTATADAGWSPAGTNLTELSTTICAANAIVAVGITAIATYRNRTVPMAHLLLLPVYGLLVSVASWRAAGQLIHSP